MAYSADGFFRSDHYNCRIFIVKLFTGNPLEGKWISEATGGTIEITDKDELIIQTEDQESSTIVRGFVDKKTKTLTVGLSGEGR